MRGVPNKNGANAKRLPVVIGGRLFYSVTRSFVLTQRAGKLASCSGKGLGETRAWRLAARACCCDMPMPAGPADMRCGCWGVGCTRSLCKSLKIKREGVVSLAQNTPHRCPLGFGLWHGATRWPANGCGGTGIRRYGGGKSLAVNYCQLMSPEIPLN